MLGWLVQGLGNAFTWLDNGNDVGPGWGTMTMMWNWMGYNRDAWMSNVAMHQNKEYQIKNYNLSWVSICREDIRDLMGLTMTKMNNYMVVTTLILGIGLAFVFEGRDLVGEGVPRFIVNAYLINLAVANLFLVLSVLFSIRASNMAVGCATELLTGDLKPASTVNYTHNYMEQTELFEKQGLKDIFRVPLLPSQFDRSKYRLKHGGKEAPEPKINSELNMNPLNKRRAATQNRYQQEPDTLGARSRSHDEDDYECDPNDVDVKLAYEDNPWSQENHILLFQNTRQLWFPFEDYAQRTMAFGLVSLLHATGYYAFGQLLGFGDNLAAWLFLAVALFLSLIIYMFGFPFHWFDPISDEAQQLRVSLEGAPHKPTIKRKPTAAMDINDPSLDMTGQLSAKARAFKYTGACMLVAAPICRAVASMLPSATDGQYTGPVWALLVLGSSLHCTWWFIMLRRSFKIQEKHTRQQDIELNVLREQFKGEIHKEVLANAERIRIKAGITDHMVSIITRLFICFSAILWIFFTVHSVTTRSDNPLPAGPADSKNDADYYYKPAIASPMIDVDDLVLGAVVWGKSSFKPRRIAQAGRGQRGHYFVADDFHVYELRAKAHGAFGFVLDEVPCHLTRRIADITAVCDDGFEEVNCRPLVLAQGVPAEVVDCGSGQAAPLLQPGGHTPKLLTQASNESLVLLEGSSLVEYAWAPRLGGWSPRSTLSDFGDGGVVRALDVVAGVLLVFHEAGLLEMRQLDNLRLLQTTRVMEADAGSVLGGCGSLALVLPPIAEEETKHSESCAGSCLNVVPQAELVRVRGEARPG